MNDKFLMENIMFGSKVMSDLYMHGVIESANESVSVAFMKALQETAKMHYDLYKEMQSSGFYTTTNIEKSKIKQTMNKLECTCTECDCDEEKE